MPVPLVIPSSSTANGTSRRSIRQRLAPLLGYYARGTVTTEAASLEADRYVISSSIKSDHAPAEHLDGLFLYVTNGDEEGSQRRVINGAFDGPLGAVYVDTAYASGPLAAGTAFEIGVMPAEEYQGLSGLNEAINLSLEELPVIDYVSITVTATGGVTDTEYSFINLSWPVKSVLEVIYPRTSVTTERRRIMPRGVWDYDLDAESPVLSFRRGPANVGETIEAKVLRPASTRIRQAGVWGNVTTGMTSDDDETLYDVSTVVKQALPIALERMAHKFERGSKEWMAAKGEADTASTAAAVSKFFGRLRGSGVQRVGAIGGR